MNDFSSSRLTIARERRGLTKRALAEAIGLSARAITGFEDGSSRPLAQTAHQMAFVLGFPLGFFFINDVEPLSEDAVSFRSRRVMTARVRDITLASGRIAYANISPELRSKFQFPAVDVPDLSGEVPEDAAAILRNHWRLGQGPIKNMVHLLESKGCEVFWINIDSDCVDAVSFWRDNQPYVVLNLHKEAGERGRFDTAHELGHLVLHRGTNMVEGKELESQADSFASAFLLPPEQFRAEAPRVPILRHYFPVKERWGVSVQALTRRSKDLGILSPWHYESSCKEISVNGWRIKEPGQLNREHSMLHKIAFEGLASKGLAPKEFAHRVQISPSDLEELAPVSAVVEKELKQAQSPQKTENLSEFRRGHLRLLREDEAA